jgi:septum formation protein
MSKPLVLASASPRRRELLARLGLVFSVEPAEVDEQPRAGETAADYALRVAADKADAVVRRASDRWILAADTVVEIRGQILGKAADPSDARRMLACLVGQTHRVSTGVVIRSPHAAAHDRLVTTEVVMRGAGPAEIDQYVASGEWRGKAGAYAVQGIAAAFVTEIRGSITNVIGLPLAEVVDDLMRLGGPVPNYSAGIPA